MARMRSWRNTCHERALHLDLAQSGYCAGEGPILGWQIQIREPAGNTDLVMPCIPR